MKINKEWHLTHLMPKNPTIDQQIAWHTEHAKKCACREIPEKLRLEMKRRKIKVR
jgi:hypothetical protein